MIAREYLRANRSTPIRFGIVTAICLAAFLISGAFVKEKTRILAIALSAFLLGITLWALLDVLTEPKRFLKRYPGIGSIISSEEPHKLGRRFFYEEFFVYFGRRRICVMRYDLVQCVEMRGNKLFMKLKDGKELPLPYEYSENPAILVAALRSKNPRLTAAIDGREVNFNKKK